MDDPMLLAKARKIAQEIYGECDTKRVCTITKLGHKIMDREDLFTPDDERNLVLMIGIGLAKLNNMEKKKDEPIFTDRNSRC